MKIFVKIKAGMDAHFRNTVEAYDKAATRKRPEPDSPWDYILENFTKCPVEEVGRWQSVEKAAADGPVKGKELKISDLYNVMQEQNRQKGRNSDFGYRIFIVQDGKKPVRAHCRIGENGKCLRIDDSDNDRASMDSLRKLYAKVNDVPIKIAGGKVANEIKILSTDDQAVGIYF